MMRAHERIAGRNAYRRWNRSEPAWQPVNEGPTIRAFWKGCGEGCAFVAALVGIVGMFVLVAAL